jgi:hypothetical protein
LFSNSEDFTVRAMFSVAGKGEMPLLRFQDENTRLNKLKCLLSNDPAIRRSVEEDVMMAAKATEDVDELIQVAEKELNEAMKTLSETKKALYDTKTFLENVKAIQNADTLDPSQHTIQTVSRVCAGIDFIGTSPRKIAAKLRIHSINDLEEVSDRKTLIALLKIAQENETFKNPKFEENMKKLIAKGIFHRGERFPIGRILHRSSLSHESAVALVGFYFDVSGCDDHPEGTKFQEKHDKGSGNGSPWTTTIDPEEVPPSPVPPSYTYSAMPYCQGKGPLPWSPAMNGSFAPTPPGGPNNCQGGYFPPPSGNMYQPPASSAPDAATMNGHFAPPPSGGPNNGQGGYIPPPSLASPPAFPATNSATGPPGSAPRPSTWTPTTLPVFNIGSSTPKDKKSQHRSAPKKPTLRPTNADSDSMQM